MMRILFFTAVFACVVNFSYAERQRWALEPDGAISWTVKDIPEDKNHTDTIEISGARVAGNLRYGMNGLGGLHIERWLIWPALRFTPNRTHTHLALSKNWNIYDHIFIDGKPLARETVKKFSLNGMLAVESEIANGDGKTLALKSELFPSQSRPVWCDLYTVENNSGEPVEVTVKGVFETEMTSEANSLYGPYEITREVEDKTFRLEPGAKGAFQAYVGAYRDGEERGASAEKELKGRKKFLKAVASSLVLETPDEVVNRMFAFAKIHAAEDIFETAAGFIHCPGGGGYYAGVWANDQAEYANPFFPYLGYGRGNEAALNCFRLFAQYIGTCMPSSVICEGLYPEGVAGDRGDSAMVAYGAGRYLLARGSRKEAEELWPLIEWCIEYCESKINSRGVVASDSDELENRFPAGSANLCTTSLYYDALISASYLARDLGKPGLSKKYMARSKEIRKNLEKHFGAEVEGFKTYRYYDGNDILRSWICIPLCMGIYDRKGGTVAALLSPRLMTENGLLTQAGTNNFWDRSTLYALRGIFAAGEADKAYEFLKHYSAMRLLGDHVPYAIEAFPEGNQRHLSAESALYARVLTEGVFGIRPTGLNSFSVSPSMPKAWNEMALRKVRLFGKNFDIIVKREGEKFRVDVVSSGGKTFSQILAEGAAAEFKM